ncbi:DM13 domain-containing protein [Nonomuraea sp. NPDC049152]|uniref:DM13 domain-containing protein n=1 Tax=Nonomuraea sp. NPDC049152 TaxID=3154350 RepID=UPI00340A3791
MKLLRHPLTWIAAAVVFGVAMYLFQPWRLFTTVEVNEPFPVAATAPSGEANPPAASRPSEGGPSQGEPSPSVPRARVAPAATVLLSGDFVTHEHKTSGVAKVLRLPDGRRVLRIEGLATSDGPDLRVWLSDQPVTDSWRNFDDGEYLELGHLKGNKGNANYAIPAAADLGRLTSVSIWCKRFSVSFGAAALTAGNR